jgi:UDP-N-acetylmuramyl pentapeptide phosphotransferase/UDP-N-acetylglucosamine-1-phosphate transferase
MQIMDAPNERSLHRRAVPRGGGIAIAIVFLGYQITFLNPFSADGFEVAAQAQASASALVWLICGLLFGAMGGLDDLKPRSVTWRLSGQVLLAILFTWFCFPNQFLICSVFFACISFLIVFIVNVFNFLDGADGYASSQAILFICGYLFLGWSDLPMELLALSSVLAGAILGFFLFNFHPARIFLGDLGSYFIGFQLIAISIFGTLDGMAIHIPLILLAPFICDALLTLLKRIITREKWWSAHREHAYQRLVLNGMGVRTLNVWLVTINLGVCWPAAWLVAENMIDSIWGIGCVYTFLGIIWYYAPKIDKKSISHSSDPFLN